MKKHLSIALLFCMSILFGQSNNIENKPLVELSQKVNEYSHPLFIAQNSIVDGKELDASLIENIWVVKAPESIEKLNNAGINGLVMVKTKQKFKTISLDSIRKKKLIKGQVVYKIDGRLVNHLNLKISIKAIKKIETFGPKNSSALSQEPTVINICTNYTDDSSSIPAVCRGVGGLNLIEEKTQKE